MVGGSGRDLFRCVVMPTNLTEDKFVAAYEVRPSNRRVVHHTLNFIDTQGQGRKLEEKEKERAKKQASKCPLGSILGARAGALRRNQIWDRDPIAIRSDETATPMACWKEWNARSSLPRRWTLEFRAGLGQFP